MIIQIQRDLYKHLLFIVCLFITICCAEKANSQTILLPGDIVVVSVNATNNTFDFIPLINIKKGTSIWFSNGEWDPDSLQFVSGQELKVDVLENIEAGTTIHINEVNYSGISVTGKMTFSGKAKRLFVYQNDNEAIRPVYAVGWGSKEVWNPKKKEGSEKPGNLIEHPYTILTLGYQQNHQYHLWNGASGTRNMLRKFVGTPANWRNSNDKAYSSFGTSFRLLEGPVVMFDEGISTWNESDNVATLNVAIYEHDGSKLTVDVAFDSSASILNKRDIVASVPKTLNFTGLIGDAVYEVQIPINNDKLYEGQESGVFRLTNLSKGVFGDFITHTLFLNDDEEPEINISNVLFAQSGYSQAVDITNRESVPVNLKDWALVNGNQKLVFGKNAIIESGHTLRVLDADGKIDDQKPLFQYYESSEWVIEKGEGTLKLLNSKNKTVSTFKYESDGFELNITDSNLAHSTSISAPPAVSSSRMSMPTTAKQVLSTPKALQPGWYAFSGLESVPDKLLDHVFYSWDEVNQEFTDIALFSEDETKGKARLCYMDSVSVISFTREKGTLQKENSLHAPNLEFYVSATDANENGIIDQAEGFNFLSNGFTFPIPVKTLLSKIGEKVSEHLFEPYVYLWEDSGAGWGSVNVLDENESIPAGSSFWMKASVPFQPFTFSIAENEIDEISIMAADDVKPEAVLGLFLGNGDADDKVIINFYPEGKAKAANIVNPLMLSKLNITPGVQVALGITGGNFPFRTVNHELNNEQKSTFPLSFVTNISGSFNMGISNWENIPLNWQIILSDNITGKEYILTPNWTLNFDYFVSYKAGRDEENITSEKGKEPTQNRFLLTIVPSAANVFEEEIEMPGEVLLHQNFPNPFNPLTTISFYLPEPVPVKLSVFNIVGQPIAVLIDETMGIGEHQKEWDATDLPSGMYIYQLEVGNKIMTRKMTLVK